MKQFYVYIMTNNSRTLYVGVTNNLGRRVYQHNNLTKLAYYEYFGNIRDAIAREKQIKEWTRAKKLSLIEAVNPA
jgi:putative endonuclease